MISVVASGLLLLSLLVGPKSSLHGYWTDAAPMLFPATGQMAVGLRDGRVMCMGGEAVTDGFPVPTTQIYDPRTNRWQKGPDMAVGRIGSTATVLSDGGVLVAGGLGPKLRALRSAEIFDPSANAWRRVARLPATRFSQSAVLVPDGRVLVVGGIVGKRISTSALFFDPNRGVWLPAPSSLHVHAEQSSLVLPGGRILLVGGYGQPEAYDPAAGTWTSLRGTATRLHPVVAVLHTGSVLVAGGRSGHDRDLRSARLFDPASGRWSPAGALQVQRSEAVGAVLEDGSVLVAGGEQVTVHVLRAAERFNPATRAWSPTSPMRTARDAAIASSLPGGNVLVCGGTNLRGVLRSCEIYHP